MAPATRSQSGFSSVFGFTGEQSDAATGNVFLRARYLSPSLGRFLSADTVQPNAPGTQGYNLYGYVANNPATWIDPTGHVAGALVLLGLAIAAVFLLIALYLLLVILQSQGYDPDDLIPPRENPFSSPNYDPAPSGPGGSTWGRPDAGPVLPVLELIWPHLPNWQWDTPRSEGDSSGTYQAKLKDLDGNILNPQPKGTFKGKTGPDRAFDHLEEEYDLDPHEASERLHEIKSGHGMPPNANVIFGKDGSVWDEKTGALLGNLLE